MAGLLDNLINQLRGNYGPNWEGAVGLPIPQMTDPRQFGGEPAPGGQPPAGPAPRFGAPANQGGIRSVDDARDQARRGAADATAANIGQAMGLAGGMMSGTGALSTGLQGIASQTDIGKRLGIDNPFKDLAGFAKPTAAQIAQNVTSSNPIAARNQAARLTERAYREAKVKDTAGRLGSSMGASRGGARGRGGYGGGGRSGGSSGGSSRGSRGE